MFNYCWIKVEIFLNFQQLPSYSKTLRKLKGDYHRSLRLDEKGDNYS